MRRALSQNFSIVKTVLIYYWHRIVTKLSWFVTSSTLSPLFTYCLVRENNSPASDQVNSTDITIQLTNCLWQMNALRESDNHRLTFNRKLLRLVTQRVCHSREPPIALSSFLDSSRSLKILEVCSQSSISIFQHPSVTTESIIFHYFWSGIMMSNVLPEIINLHKVIWIKLEYCQRWHWGHSLKAFS